MRARYISETIVSSISAVKSVLDIPKDLIKVGFKRNLIEAQAKELFNCRKQPGRVTGHQTMNAPNAYCAENPSVY